ncbi:hypothetical protein TSMEX_001244 [Taenia solium]|eukprot:TsM_001200700 transcript=TsM_001200700 gene=TsM_001200700
MGSHSSSSPSLEVCTDWRNEALDRNKMPILFKIVCVIEFGTRRLALWYQRRKKRERKALRCDDEELHNSNEYVPASIFNPAVDVFENKSSNIKDVCPFRVNNYIHPTRFIDGFVDRA